MNERMSFAPAVWPRKADTSALNGFELRSEGDWLALVDLTPLPDGPRPSGLGGPGLWRIVQDGAALRRVHDLPQLRGAEGAPSAEEFTRLLEWASATFASERAGAWTPPPREEVESWLTPARLSVRSGSLLARGELVHEPRRLALVFPDLVVAPANLSPARREWLDGLLLDAQQRWRLVRFGIDADTRRVQAEVDLSGIPAAWARPFLQLSLEALAWAVEWLLSPLSFLVDPSASSEALERHSFHSLNRS